MPRNPYPFPRLENDDNFVEGDRKKVRLLKSNNLKSNDTHLVLNHNVSIRTLLQLNCNINFDSQSS